MDSARPGGGPPGEPTPTPTETANEATSDDPGAPPTDVPTGEAATGGPGPVAPAPPEGEAGASGSVAGVGPGVLARLDELLDAVRRVEEVAAAAVATAPDGGEVLAVLGRVEASVASSDGAGEVLAAVERLDRRSAERDRLAERDRDLVDRLHAENQRLRAGELFQAMAPVARDLVRLRDQARQLDAASPEPGRSDAALIEAQLLQILARLGVEPYQPAPGDRFDPAWHQGVGRRPNPDPAVDGTVAGVRREGFVGPDGRSLRPADVEVWRHDPAADPGPTPAGPAPAGKDPAGDDDDHPLEPGGS